MLAAVKHQRGLGLVELIIAVAVLGIIAAVATPSFSDMLNRRRVQAVATSISTDLAYLRTEQSLRPKDLMMSVNNGNSTSCYAIYFTAQFGNCNSCWEPDPLKVCTGNVALVRAERVPNGTGVTFAASSATVQFSQAQLKPTPSNFSLDVCGASNINPRPVLRVELNPVGRAKMCSPNSSMSGYGTCTNTTAPQCPS